MSNIYVFRVVLDVADEDIYRDIEIHSSQSLEDFHNGILTAFDIKTGEMASFYATDEEWTQKDEIPLIDMGLGDAKHGEMQGISINFWLDNFGKRALYLYDYLNMWTFFVELVSQRKASEIDLSEKNILSFPKTIYICGASPKSAPDKNFQYEEDFEIIGGADDEENEETDDENRFNDYHDEW